MAFSTFIILHSELDGASRFFVAGNYSPDNPEVQLIDWNDPAQRAAYEAVGMPYPSAFPAVVNTQNGEIINVPKSLEDAIAILTGVPTMQEKVAQLENDLATANAQIEQLNLTVQELIAGTGTGV